MPRWLRRLRSAAIIGLAWAAAWFGAGMVLLVIVGPNAADVPFPLFFGLLGFLCGTTFSGLLSAVARRRTLADLALPRVASWGAAAGLLVVLVFMLLAGVVSAWPVLTAVFASAGALCATGTIALARRGADATDDVQVELDALADASRQAVAEFAPSTSKEKIVTAAGAPPTAR